MVWELLTGSRPPLPRSSVGSRLPASSVPSLIGRVDAVPDGLDAVLSEVRARTGPAYASVADFVLGWRAATGRPEGAVTPVTSSERRDADSSRRRAAQQLTMAASAGVNPYRGLRPFDEADAMSFHGRGEVVDRSRRRHRLDAVRHRRRCLRLGQELGRARRSRSAAAGARWRRRDHDADGGSARRAARGPHRGRHRLGCRRIGCVDRRAGRRRPAARSDGRRHRPVRGVLDTGDGGATATPSSTSIASTIADDSIDVRFVATVRADLLDRPLEHPALGPRIGAGAVRPVTALPDGARRGDRPSGLARRGAVRRGRRGRSDRARPSRSPDRCHCSSSRSPSSTTDGSTA